MELCSSYHPRINDPAVNIVPMSCTVIVSKPYSDYAFSMTLLSFDSEVARSTDGEYSEELALICENISAGTKFTVGAVK
jgi:hypothetical protein